MPQWFGFFMLFIGIPTILYLIVWHYYGDGSPLDFLPKNVRFKLPEKRKKVELFTIDEVEEMLASVCTKYDMRIQNLRTDIKAQGVTIKRLTEESIEHENAIWALMEEIKEMKSRKPVVKKVESFVEDILDD